MKKLIINLGFILGVSTMVVGCTAFLRKIFKQITAFYTNFCIWDTAF